MNEHDENKFIMNLHIEPESKQSIDLTETNLLGSYVFLLILQGISNKYNAY